MLGENPEQEERLSRNDMLMSVAMLMAQRGTCTRLKVGAIITVDSRIVGSGYVGAPQRIDHCNSSNCHPDKPCTRTIHAEQNAIAFCARYGTPTEGCTIYCTHQPCAQCARLIIQAGIVKVVYGMEYRDPEGLNLLKQAGVDCVKYRQGL
jgi:dCMP deaminase